MSRKKIIVLTIVLLALFAIGYYYFTHRNNNAYQFVSVTRGPITQTVSVTGNTTPSYSVSLGFGNSGIISKIYSAVGNRVEAGTVLASLDTGDLSAQLKQAQGNVDAQKAKLLGLQAGSRPEDISYSEALLLKGEQDLANMYSGIGDISADAYAKATDAVRTQLNAFFSNGGTSHPTLTYTISDSQAENNIDNGRNSARQALEDWQAELRSIGESSVNKDLARLLIVRTLLDNIQRTLDGASTSLNVSTLAAYQANIGLAVAEVNVAIKNLNDESQKIASQKLTVAQLQAQLDLKKAGYTSEDVAAQAAAVTQAEASVESIQAKLRNSVIIAPQSGVITQFDAKVGQIASPTTPLVSIISDNSFEIDAVVPETDIGKVSLHNKVSITLDAFPGEILTGSVFYIDPAQTNNSGVVGYKIKVMFNKTNPQMKSGLTANLDIETTRKESTLILPQYAILQTDLGTFVEVLVNNVAKQIPVTLGIQDQKGNVEVVSGVSEGSQVLNIGLKK